MGEIIPAAAGVFAGTNVDDIIVLTVLFLAARTSGRPRPWQIWVGQYAGIAVLVALIGSQRRLVDPLDGFRQLWLFAATTAIASGVIGSFIPRPTRTRAVDVHALPVPVAVDGQAIGT